MKKLLIIFLLGICLGVEARKSIITKQKINIEEIKGFDLVRAITEIAQEAISYDKWDDLPEEFKSCYVKIQNGEKDLNIEDLTEITSLLVDWALPKILEDDSVRYKRRTMRKIEATLITELPFVITVPGRYHLAKDLKCLNLTEGIIIEAEDVIIDLNGNTLKGNGVCAITAYFSDNLEISNGYIEGFSVAVFADSSKNISFESIKINNCDKAFFFDSVTKASIKKCLFKDIKTVFLRENSGEIEFSDCFLNAKSF